MSDQDRAREWPCGYHGKPVTGCKRCDKLAVFVADFTLSATEELQAEVGKLKRDCLRVFAQAADAERQAARAESAESRERELQAINAELCKDKSALLIEGATLQERVRVLTEALTPLVDYTYESAIPGGDGALQRLRAHASAVLLQVAALSVPAVPLPATQDARIRAAYDRVAEHDNAKLHETVAVLIWADIDVGIADYVRALNKILGVRTIASCQGTTAYRPYILATWPVEVVEILRQRFEIEELGDCWGYLRPAVPTKEKP